MFKSFSSIFINYFVYNEFLVNMNIMINNKISKMKNAVLKKKYLILEKIIFNNKIFPLMFHICFKV